MLHIDPATVAAITPSTVLSAIEAHERAYGGYLYGLCDKGTDLGDLREAERAAFHELVHVPLANDAERVAYAVAVIARENSPVRRLGEGRGRNDPLAVAFRNLSFGEHAWEPEGGPGVVPLACDGPDPVLAAIADSRKATAAIEDFHRQRSGPMSGAEMDRERILSSEDYAARRAVWKTPPTTQAGRRALVEFARQQIEAHSDTDGMIETDGVLPEIFGALAAMVEAEGALTTARPDTDSNDSVYAALDAYRTAEAAYSTACVPWNEARIGSPGYNAAEAVARRQGVLEAEAWATLTAARPTTFAGLVALAGYLPPLMDRIHGSPDEDPPYQAMLMLCADITAVAATPARDRQGMADPHLALLPDLRQAFAWTREAHPFGDEPSNSPEGRAHTAVLHHSWDLANRIADLPPPTTLAGLGALALAMSVYAEEIIGRPQNDGLDHERYPEERRIAAAVRAMMSVAGVSPFPGWVGFEAGPDSEARWRAVAEQAGEGFLPAWALAGKTGPDADAVVDQAA